MDDTQLDAVCEAIKVIFDRQESINERLTTLEKSYNEELLGSIKSIYGEKVRGEGIDGLKGSYAEKFGGMTDDFSNMYGGDLWEKLYDAVSELADAEREPAIMDIYNKLKEKFDKVKGVKAEVAIAAPVEEPKKAEEPAAEIDPMDEIRNTVQRLKGRGRKSGMMLSA